jgi:hypothetical protein
MCSKEPLVKILSEKEVKVKVEKFELQNSFTAKIVVSNDNGTFNIEATAPSQMEVVLKLVDFVCRQLELSDAEAERLTSYLFTCINLESLNRYGVDVDYLGNPTDVDYLGNPTMDHEYLGSKLEALETFYKTTDSNTSPYANETQPHTQTRIEFDREIEKCRALLLRKEHDYGQSWREMRVESITDQILTKIRRVKRLEDLIRAGKEAAISSEGIDAEYRDIINYCAFALIKLGEENDR